MWSKTFSILAISAIALSIYFLIFSETQTVTMTQQTVQQSIDEQLPIIGKFEGNGYSITEAEVVITSTGLEVTGNSIVKIASINRKRHVSFESFNSELSFKSGYFYLANIQMGNNIVAENVRIGSESYGTFSEKNIQFTDGKVQVELSKAPFVGTFWLYVIIAIAVILLIILAARAGVLDLAFLLFMFSD
jgi:hypothetical protein